MALRGQNIETVRASGGGSIARENRVTYRIGAAQDAAAAARGGLVAGHGDVVVSVSVPRTNCPAVVRRPVPGEGAVKDGDGSALDCPALVSGAIALKRAAAHR